MIRHYRVPLRETVFNFCFHVRHYRVPLSGTVLNCIHWLIPPSPHKTTLYILYLHSQDSPSFVLCILCGDNVSYSQTRDSGAPLSRTVFHWSRQIKHSGVPLSGSILWFCRTGRTCRTCPTGVQLRHSGVLLSRTVFHYRLLAHESYRAHRNHKTYKPHPQFRHSGVPLSGSIFD